MTKDIWFSLKSSPLFWLGLAIKLLLIPFFASEYLSDLFIPFMDRSISNLGINPWALAKPNEFPYGGVLFFVVFVPKYFGYMIFGDASLGANALNFALIKLPLLVFDFILLCTLVRMNGQGVRRLLVFYWLNPILIFISYGLGQLDVVCMAFLFLSLMSLIEKRHLFSAIFFGGAILCKFHVILLIPLILAFTWNNLFSWPALKQGLTWLGIVTLVAILGFIPHVTSGNAGYVSGGSPEAQRIFSLAFNLGNQEVLLLGVMMLLLLLGRLCLSTKIGASGLVHGCGALMTLLVLTVNPAEGWFYWFLPFVALLYAQYVGLPRLLYVGLIAAYFLHFLVGKYFFIFPVQGLSLTLLQTFTACFWIAAHLLVLRFDAPILRRLKPYMIGVSGDSGAGKNYLTQKIQDLFSPQNTLVIEGDDYHKWERGDKEWQEITHLNPKANNLQVLHLHSTAMERGQFISSRHYNHETGKFTEERELAPAKTVVIQGLHALFSPLFRKRMDLKIFLKPSEEVRRAWKIQRDVQERGHSQEKVVASIDDRQKDSERFIRPQEEAADWVIEYQRQGDSYCVHHRLSNTPGLIEFLEGLQQIGCKVRFGEIDPSCLSVSIEGSPKRPDIESFAYSQFDSLRQALRTSRQPKWAEGLDGTTQLLLLYQLSFQSQGNLWH